MSFRLSVVCSVSVHPDNTFDLSGWGRGGMDAPMGPWRGGKDAIGAELEWMKSQQMSLEQKRGLLELRCWIQIMTCHEDN